MLKGARGGILSLADAGQASLASFAASIYALRVLDEGALALYALVFAAGVVLMIVPQFAVFMIQRLHVNRHHEIYRPRYRADLRQSAPLFAVAVLVVFLAGLPLRSETGLGVFLVICGSAAGWVVASPIQDHVRQALHASLLHGCAAAVSTANLVTVVAGIAVAELVSIDGAGGHLIRAAVPFTLMILGNVVSASVGVLLHRKVPVVPERAVHGWRDSALASVPPLLTHGANYLRNLLIALLVGPAALVALEAARIASQPVLILGTGLAAYFMPAAVRLLGAGRVKDAYRRIAQQNSVIVAGGLVFSGALVWVAPVIATIADRAIQVPLAISRGVAATLGAAAAPYNGLNFAALKYRRAVTLTAVSEVAGLAAVLALAAGLGAYAMPVAAGLAGVVRIVSELTVRRRERRAGEAASA